MMSKTNQSQSVLARLLAKENIKIQHGNFSTAFFDVKNRILGLPNWKDKGKDVYDLLCGHEVGHALYTPADAFDGDLSVRKDLLNVVEDVRIERMIQETYPGLTRCFRSAYAQLKDENFFGINGRNVNSLGFADRINLKAKLGNLIDVAFSAREEEIRQKIHAAQTWSEVLEATALLEKFLNEPKPQQPEDESKTESAEQSSETSQEPGNSPQSSEQSAETPEAPSTEASSAEDDSADEQPDTQSDTADGLSSDSSETEDGQTKSNSQEASGEADGQDTASKTEDQNDQTPAAGDAEVERNAEPTTHDNSVVETQTAFDTNAKTLLDTSNETLQTAFVQGPNDRELDEVIIPYRQIAANRLRNTYYVEAAKNKTDEFAAFMKHTRKVVAVLTKEFELRKAAYQYSRATVSKTGSLNVERLHAYKVSDDLFLSVTKLANAKNHAMMMFVDYSGSMQRVLPHVLKHLINLSVFCRNLGIPFRVYGFTSDNGFTTEGRSSYYPTQDEIEYDRVLISNLNLIELVSSELSKTDFNQAIYALWLRSQSECTAGIGERLGNTPLNETLIVAHKLVSKFKATYNPDRMISIFLTDGAGQSLRYAVSSQQSQNRILPPSGWMFSNKLSFKLNGRTVCSRIGGDDMTSALLENLRITTGSETIGFFIPANFNSLRHKAVAAIASANKIPFSTAYPLWTNKAEKSYKENDVLSVPGAFNYSNFFVVASGEDLSLDDEEMEITENMTRGRMARVFTAYSKGKRTNRVFVTKFAEALA